MGSLPASVRIVHKDSSHKWCMKVAESKDQRKTLSMYNLAICYLCTPGVFRESWKDGWGLGQAGEEHSTSRWLQRMSLVV